MAIGGSAVCITVDQVIEAGRRMAGELLEAAHSDIEFEEGRYRITGTDRTVTLPDVALASFEQAERPGQRGLAFEVRVGGRHGLVGLIAQWALLRRVEPPLVAEAALPCVLTILKPYQGPKRGPAWTEETDIVNARWLSNEK